MDLEAPILLLASQPLGGNFRITLSAPLPSSHTQQPTISPTLKLFLARSHYELLSSSPIMTCVHRGPSCVSVLPVSLHCQSSFHIGLSDVRTALDHLGA